MARLDVLRSRTLTVGDVEPLVTDLRARGYEVGNGEYFEKSADEIIKAGLMAVVYLATDETAREFVRLALRRILDFALGLSRDRGTTKVDIWFRAGGEDGTELRMSVRTDEREAMKRTEGVVTRLAEVGIVRALDKLPADQKIAFFHLPLDEHIYCRGSDGRFYFFDPETGRWTPRRPRE